MVTDIRYNARGRRTRIERGNGPYDALYRLAEATSRAHSDSSTRIAHGEAARGSPSLPNTICNNLITQRDTG